MTIEELKKSFDELEKEVKATERAFLEWDAENLIKRAFKLFPPDQVEKMFTFLLIDYKRKYAQPKPKE